MPRGLARDRPSVRLPPPCASSRLQPPARGGPCRQRLRRCARPAHPRSPGAIPPPPPALPSFAAERLCRRAPRFSAAFGRRASPSPPRAPAAAAAGGAHVPVTVSRIFLHFSLPAPLGNQLFALGPAARLCMCTCAHVKPPILQFPIRAGVGHEVHIIIKSMDSRTL